MKNPRFKTDFADILKSCLLSLEINMKTLIVLQ